MSDKIRVLRVLEYVGPRDLVEDHLNQRHLKGQVKFRAGPDGRHVHIRESLLAEFPELLTEESQEAGASQIVAPDGSPAGNGGPRIVS